LGLFGLVSFSAERRRKEIGIRKVLGAAMQDVVVLLCRDFVILIGISLAIGLPVAWWLADRFLSGYQFHVDVGITFFLWTIGATFGLAIAAVSIQSIRAALSNPVDTLKSE
jgi:putative ABC transport system permease protein